MSGGMCPLAVRYRHPRAVSHIRGPLRLQNKSHRVRVFPEIKSANSGEEAKK